MSDQTTAIGGLEDELTETYATLESYREKACADEREIERLRLLLAAHDADRKAARKAVVVASDATMHGLVITWRRHPAATPVLTVSRHHLLIRGDIYVDPDFLAWLSDARAAHAALQAGRDHEARALATHTHRGLFGDELIPIRKATTK